MVLRPGESARRGRAHRLRARAAGRVQGAQDDRAPRRAAPHGHGQGAEVQAARGVLARARAGHQRSTDPLLAWTASTPRSARSARVRAFCDREVIPIINDCWERAEFPFELVPKIAELGLAGGTIEGYGCPGMSATGRRPRDLEWARADGSIGDLLRRALEPRDAAIDMLGSEEQRERWLPRMAALEAIGAFGLTEPDHGSDAVAPGDRAPAATATSSCSTAPRSGSATPPSPTSSSSGRATRTARSAASSSRRARPGFHTEVITGKTRLRAVWQAEITLDGVRVPAEAGCRAAVRSADVAPRADPHALHRGLAGARRRARRLRGGAGLRQGARAVRAAAGLLPARAGQAEPHAGARSPPCSSSACA